MYNKSSRTCDRWTGYNFVKAAVRLQNNRKQHMCWVVSNGVLLLGGYSQTTTELVSPDGSSSTKSFRLIEGSQYVSNILMNLGFTFPLISKSCGIDRGDGTFVVTGGEKDNGKGKKQSAVYSEHGFLMNLPPLKEARRDHGCAKYHDTAGQVV